MNDLIKPRTIFAGLIYGVVIYLAITRQEIPSVLEHAMTSLLGFYFGQRAVKYGNK